MRICIRINARLYSSGNAALMKKLKQILNARIKTRKQADGTFHVKTLGNHVYAYDKRREALSRKLELTMRYTVQLEQAKIVLDALGIKHEISL